MELADLIVIYLACGSPFCVYQITKSEKAASARDRTGVVLSFLFWPVFLIYLLANRLAPGAGNDDAADRTRIEFLRGEIEQAAFLDRTTASLFEFREVFYRYAGLVEAARTEQAVVTRGEIFEISGHRNADLASRCMARRNRERLSFHATRTRNEFVTMIADLCGRDPAREIQIVNLALELTRLLADPAAIDDLTALIPGRANVDALSNDIGESPLVTGPMATDLRSNRPGITVR